MSGDLAVVVYSLCLGTSGLCVVMLIRAWRASGSRLLLWTAVSFLFLTLNNLALLVDMEILPAVDLWFLRSLATLLALGLLLFGFIWESEA